MIKKRKQKLVNQLAQNLKNAKLESSKKTNEQIKHLVWAHKEATEDMKRRVDYLVQNV